MGEDEEDDEDDEAEAEEDAEAKRNRKAHYKEKLLSTEVGLSHMHLKEGDDIKALAVYEEYRGDRVNFAELKCIHTTNEDHQENERHLMRLFKEHLGNVRFSYLIYQAREEELGAYNDLYFYAITYSELPNDVKKCMPLIPGRVCMKFLLPDWQTNRHDLTRKPVGYPESLEGEALR